MLSLKYKASCLTKEDIVQGPTLRELVLRDLYRQLHPMALRIADKATQVALTRGPQFKRPQRNRWVHRRPQVRLNGRR